MSETRILKRTFSCSFPMNIGNNHGILVINTHPLFQNVKIGQFALHFTSWKCYSYKIIWQPLVGTGHDGLLYSTERSNCMGLEYSYPYDSIISGDNESQPVWRPREISLSPSTDKFYPIRTTRNLDCPVTCFLYVDPNIVAIAGAGRILIEASYQFYQQTYLKSTNIGPTALVTFESSANGIKRLTNVPNGHLPIVGFVVASYVPSIEIGHFVSVTSLPSITEYSTTGYIFHNNIALDRNLVNDHGQFIVLRTCHVY